MIERDGQRLIMRFVPGADRYEDDLLLFQETAPPVTAEALASFDLTRRKREILEGIVPGWSNAEIAVRCAISVGTVKKHLEHIYAKLGMSSRTAVINLALALARRNEGNNAKDATDTERNREL